MKVCQITSKKTDYILRKMYELATARTLKLIKRNLLKPTVT